MFVAVKFLFANGHAIHIVWGVPMVDELTNDLLYAIRILLKKPGFTAMVVLTLGLGIGVNTAIFSVVQTVLLRPFPYEEPERLVVVWDRNLEEGRSNARVTAGDFFDWKEQNSVFEEMALLQSAAVTLVDADGAEQLLGARVSASYFPVLGVHPILGRAFSAEENEPGAEPVVILGYSLWRQRFGADPTIIGADINLDGTSTRVVGVMPEGLYPTFVSSHATLPLRQNLNDIWIPFHFDEWKDDRVNHGYGALARLREGVSLNKAQADIDIIAARLGREYSKTNKGHKPRVLSFHDDIVGDVRPALLVLLGAVSLLLLTACANVGNFLLARFTTRRTELAIRQALGVGSGRLARQLLTETLLLAVVGGVLGIVFALWGVEILGALAPKGVPRLNEIGIDGGTLGFALAISLLAGIASGLAPSILAGRATEQGALKEGRGSSRGSGQQRLRRLLVVSEVTIAVVMVITAGLMVKSFRTLQQTDPGFEADNVLVMMVALPPTYSDRNQITSFFGELLERLEALPGVRSVAAGWDSPLSASIESEFAIEGRPEPRDRKVHSAWLRIVTPKYFRTAAIHMLRGRTFNEYDREDTPKIAIVNEAFVQTHFGNEDPIGERLKMSTPPVDSTETASTVWEIVGIVSDVKFLGPETGTGPAIYLPFRQSPMEAMQIILATDEDPLRLAAAAREQVWDVDPKQPIMNVSTLESILESAIVARRFNLQVMGFFGVVALALALIGIHGLVVFSVAQRTHEMGIRIALGARTGDVIRLIVGEELSLVAVGVTAGLFCVFLIKRLLASLLFDVSPTDPTVVCAVIFGLVLMVLLACYIPARRAARIEPLVAIRSE
jgi:putative ABC transport system permease protein